MLEYVVRPPVVDILTRFQGSGVQGSDYHGGSLSAVSLFKLSGDIGLHMIVCKV